MKGSDRNISEEHQGYIDYRSFCEQWVDKMDFVVSDAPCTFEADPSRSAFRFPFSFDGKELFLLLQLVICSIG